MLVSQVTISDTQTDFTPQITQALANNPTVVYLSTYYPQGAAIAKQLPKLPAGSRVLGFNYDTGERYLSVPDFLPVERDSNHWPMPMGQPR